MKKCIEKISNMIGCIFLAKVNFCFGGCFSINPVNICYNSITIQDNFSADMTAASEIIYIKDEPMFPSCNGDEVSCI